MRLNQVWSSLLLAVALSGCASFDHQNNYLTVVDIVNHFAAQKLKIEQFGELQAPFMDSAVRMVIGEQSREIAIYKYDITIPKQLERLERIRECGYMAINGSKYPALVNGSFVMIGYEKNSEKHAIVEAFKSFK